ncbi:PhzF family phenazine biosynthesis protein [Peptostreptococcus equinus]|uniref:PhzF family phenazine biosynthesis protein n=1 Tax=Peptostreptococcus equinus TaxID=3003601 RepID=A0ABY7JRX0_9FIRM|nr:PhzF family phenazine biosynthesis protein [Peptostreptococcus sp. CBA3647]WAW14437.1 PhzF family phenazine biosynthesis protein [Peptostreptococcus sp. CBA3647]
MKQYIVDAFTDKIFKGNPAAVCILNKWISDELMMNITKENNLSETAFAVKESEKYHLRWFTPGGEIDLCGHATLASAYVILNYYEKNTDSVTFTTLSGDLQVNKNNDLYTLVFPKYEMKKIEVTNQMEKAFGNKPIEAYIGRDLVCVFDNEDKVINFEPIQSELEKLPGLLQHSTSKSKMYDCISRSFAPKCNVTEDPVCGSGHCHIIPIWAEKLEKNELIAFQASNRTGILYCKLDDDKVVMSGNATLYSISELQIK